MAAACAIGGSLLLFIGTYLHPSETDPNEPVAAFTEYAADHFWVMSHLTQFAGVTLVVTVLLLRVRQMEHTRPWAQIVTGGAMASLAVAAALQAVDGIALKVMVDRWAAAPPAQKEGLFYAAFAVRQVEIGLASISSLLFGLTVMVCGIALRAERTCPTWLGGFGMIGGVLLALSGVVMAAAGFSQLAMILWMPVSSLLLVWIVVLGVLMWR